MFPLVILGFLAAVNTAEWYDPYDYNNGFQDRMDGFWENFDQQMNDLDKKIKNVVKRSKNQGSSSGIDGNKFKITIYLTGFNKEDIVVNANKGNLVIRAIHNTPGEPTNNYLYVRNLPDFVDENGSWSYNNGILTIVFPIIPFGSDDSSSRYVNNENDKPSENKDPDENSYGTSKLQSTSDPNQYEYEDSIQPSESDVE